VTTNAIQTSPVAQAQRTQTPVEKQDKPQAQKSPAVQKESLSQDTVTFSPAAKQQAGAAQQAKNGVPAKTPSTGDVDHDGDSH